MKHYITASEVKEGDVLAFGDGTRVKVERITEARCDGAIGLHGNNDTWSSWYQPGNRVRVERAEPPLEWAPLWAAMDAQPEAWIPTTEGMYGEMFERLPPRAMSGSAFLVGEPLRHVEGKAVHACFKQVGKDFFARNLTVEQFRGGVA